MKTSLFYNYREERSHHRKPPLGIMPKYLHDRLRLEDLKKTIQRMLDANEFIYQDWLDEYNELLERLYK